MTRFNTYVIYHFCYYYFQQTYEALSTDQKITLLFSALTTEGAAVGEEGRQLAAVMLRRLISSEFEDFFPKLPAEQQAQFKGQLLLVLQQEPNKGVRKKLADLVADVGRNLIDNDGKNHWPEFFQSIFEMASSPNVEMKEIALHIFR